MADATDPTLRRAAPDVSAAVVAVIAIPVLAAAAVSFLVATTFFGDDHLFLAFSRYAPDPLIAFVRDQHGGEYYRPLPMLLWWALGRAARGSTWPFAALAFLLHLTITAEVGTLVRAVRRDDRTAAIAAVLFFVAPFTRETPFWYAASTDLLATAFGVGAVVALLHRRSAVAALLFAGACWSKESAIVVPALGLLALRAREPGARWSTSFKQLAWLLPVAACYLVARSLVLGGIGGSGDQVLPLWKKLVQLGAGLIHAPTGWDVLAEGAAWTIGVAAWAALGSRIIRLARSPSRPPMLWAPWIWVVVCLGVALAAPAIVGARYFYLAAVGLAWLAADCLRSSSSIVLVGVIATLGGLDVIQTVTRRADVVSYEQRVAAAKRAVWSGLADGHTTFHIASGIKDLDLAVKADARFSRHDSELLVLTDVPESFVAIPDTRATELDFLLARPALPPAGRYQFGGRRIVGLARRGDDPTLDEVIAHLPGIRFIRLRLGPGGRVIARDATEIVRGSYSDQD